MNLLVIMITGLSVTIVVEVLFSIFLKVKNKLDILNIILVNILTNPIVVSVPFYVNVKYGLVERHITLLLLEILTVLVEGRIYQKYLNYKKINPYVLSLVLNLASYLIGVVINLLVY